jgi:hypothetical protein
MRTARKTLRPLVRDFATRARALAPCPGPDGSACVPQRDEDEIVRLLVEFRRSVCACRCAGWEGDLFFTMAAVCVCVRARVRVRMLCCRLISESAAHRSKEDILLIIGAIARSCTDRCRLTRCARRQPPWRMLPSYSRHH